MKKRINKILWHGDELLDEKAKAPEIATSDDGLNGLNEGEIYISNNEKDPALFIRTSSGKVVRVGVNHEELKKIFLSKVEDDKASGKITFEQGIALPFKTTGETEGDVEKKLQNIDSVVTSDNVSQLELFTDNAVMTAATFAKLFKVKKDPKTGKEYIHTAYSLASEGAISTKGVGEGDGQLAYVRLDEWPEKWDESLNGYVLSAGLGHGLKERIEKLEEVDEDSDKTYVHTQGTASNIWTIVHNLNKYPSVTVVDSAHTVVIGEVRYDSLDQVTVLFAATFSGMATLN